MKLKLFFLAILLPAIAHAADSHNVVATKNQTTLNETAQMCKESYEAQQCYQISYTENTTHITCDNPLFGYYEKERTYWSFRLPNEKPPERKLFCVGSQKNPHDKKLIFIDNKFGAINVLNKNGFDMETVLIMGENIPKQYPCLEHCYTAATYSQDTTKMFVIREGLEDDERVSRIFYYDRITDQDFNPWVLTKSGTTDLTGIKNCFYSSIGMLALLHNDEHTVGFVDTKKDWSTKIPVEYLLKKKK